MNKKKACDLCGKMIPPNKWGEYTVYKLKIKEKIHEICHSCDISFTSCKLCGNWVGSNGIRFDSCIVSICSGCKWMLGYYVNYKGPTLYAALKKHQEKMDQEP